MIRRLSRQGDHDPAVDDLDTISAGPAGGLDSRYKTRLAQPAIRGDTDDEIERG
jgi:hypothetical protein